MKRLANKRILLGVTGGIAAYKSADLVRRMVQAGAEVRVVMTRGACEFVSPLTFQALSGRPVHTELLDHDSESGMGHIALARWSDAIVVAPATANFMAKLCYGMADDLLTTLCLAADVPLLAAPAMNRQMWQNPATRRNAGALAERGIIILGPGDGSQACGETGPGRMLEPEDILEKTAAVFAEDTLGGIRVLVTAGPTREAIDPVRYISNRSSGRMGYAVAEAAAEAGADVTLVSGPVALDTPERVVCVPVTTALEMHEQVMARLGSNDVFISAAAVADYRCIQVPAQKIKKTGEGLVLELERTQDILAEVAASKQKPFTVGFAAETVNIREYAGNKLRDKGLDMIAANEVGNGLAFDTEDNALEVMWDGGEKSLARTTKQKLARQLIKIIAERYNEKHTNKGA